MTYELIETCLSSAVIILLLVLFGYSLFNTKSLRGLGIRMFIYALIWLFIAFNLGWASASYYWDSDREKIYGIILSFLVAIQSLTLLCMLILNFVCSIGLIFQKKIRFSLMGPWLGIVAFINFALLQFFSNGITLLWVVLCLPPLVYALIISEKFRSLEV